MAGLRRESRTWIDYSAPMIVFGLLTTAEGMVGPAWYPITYAAKILAVTAALLICRGPLTDLRWTPRVLLPSIVTGLLIIAIWLAVETFVPYPHAGDRIGFDPTTIQNTAGRYAFLAARLYGLILVVPIMEELFWRSFVLRFASRSDFLSIPIGGFSATGLGVMVAASAVAHPEWLVAAITSLLFALLLRRTGSVLATTVAHSVANAVLGAYVLGTHDWKYW